jgi:glutamine synthetase
VSETELVALVCCDLGAIVRGRSLPRSELDAHLQAGVGWVPANHSLTPLGPLAKPNPFGSTGDLRLLPDPDTHARIEADTEGDGAGALELVLCDIVGTDGTPWECCPRRFLRDALHGLECELGARLHASFEHEFQLVGAAPRGDAPRGDAPRTSGAAPRTSGDAPPASDEETPALEDSPPDFPPSLRSTPALPFSLEAQRRVEPFGMRVMGALAEAGVQPERFFSEFAAHQFEIPIAAADGLAAADRAVVLREVVREVARRRGTHASFAPLLDPDEAGNGVHVHLQLLDDAGQPLLYDAGRPGWLSELGGSFAAGILRHARALSALTAPSPVSAARLAPHHWSAGAMCLALQNREALLRIPPLVQLSGHDPASQLRLEYRGADAAANPYLALGAIVRAGLEGARAELPAPPILDRDPTQLDAAEAGRYGVGALPSSLGEALQALAEDEDARAWLPPLLYDAYLALKQAELELVADLDLRKRCRRYARVY